ncbi:MAG: ATP-binding domain-containing protein, partial [Deltaproteobacteria bacterium]|nr:ATP-binding domain-containing protein [Deltaproteobacteria bacterium]
NKLDEIAREKEISFFEVIRLALEKKLLSNSVIIKVERLYNLLTQLIEFSEKDDIVSLINHVLYKTKYLDMLEREEERRENIGEILNLAAEFGKERDHATLNDFLDSVSLASDLDNLRENSDQVTLMTLHSAKGLEFPVVFIVGMEENLLPHFNSTMNGQVEEERRLFYVGITRAKEKLYLAGATKRMIFGKQQWSIPSRFISELPKELIKWENFEYGLMKETGSSKKSSTKPISKTRKTYENSGRYKVGQKVAHSSFGEGLIKKVEGSGDEAKVTVFFPGYGLKKIIASYLE